VIHVAGLKAVGEPEHFPLTEAFPTNPWHPYAQTKLAVEWLLAGKTRRASPTTCFATGEKIPYELVERRPGAVPRWLVLAEGEPAGVSVAALQRAVGFARATPAC